MRIVLLPFAAFAFIGADAPPETVSSAPASEGVTPEFAQDGCADGVPNFNWEACDEAAFVRDRCAETKLLTALPANREEAPITRDSYDPSVDGPMQMRAVQRYENGCPVIELTSGETVPVPEVKSGAARIEPEG